MLKPIEENLAEAIKDHVRRGGDAAVVASSIARAFASRHRYVNIGESLVQVYFYRACGLDADGFVIPARQGSFRSEV